MNSNIPIAILIAGTSMIMDLRYMKIDNGWIVFSFLTALTARLIGHAGYADGWIKAFIFTLEGMLLPLGLLFLLFLMRMLGAGDIKLFCVLGFLMGPERILMCIFWSFLLGAGISLAVLFSCCDIRERAVYLINYARDLYVTRKLKPYRRPGSTPENIHFTVPVFMSVILYAGGVY